MPCNKHRLTASHAVVMCLLAAGKQKDKNRNTKTRLTSYFAQRQMSALFQKECFLCFLMWGMCRALPTFHLPSLLSEYDKHCSVLWRKEGGKNAPRHPILFARQKIDHRRCSHSAHMLTFLLFNVTDTHRQTSRISWRNNLNLANNKQASVSAQTWLRSQILASVVLSRKCNYRILPK